MKTKLFSFFCTKLFFVIVFLFLMISKAVSQSAFTVWTYEPLQGTATNPTPNTGSGSSGVVPGVGATSLAPITATGMNGTGCGAQVTGQTAWAINSFYPGTLNENSGVQYNSSTLGYQNILFSYDQRSSGTSPNTTRVQYTIDGVSWINFVMTATNTTVCLGTINTNGCMENNTTADRFRRTTIDLTTITGANNNPNFGIRILAAFFQTTSIIAQTQTQTQVPSTTSGTWRFDNVTFSGTKTPGPTASILSGTASICNGASTNLKIDITGGTSPFIVVYTDGTTNFTVNNYLTGTNILVNPTTTTTYTLVSINNTYPLLIGGAGTGNSGAALVTVNLVPVVTATSPPATCSTLPFDLTPYGNPPGGTFSIPNPYSGSSTSFTYFYSNGTCSATSSSATFTRNTAPNVVSQPSTATQTQCQGAVFAAVAISVTGTAPISYQWYSNTIQSTIGGTILNTASQISSGSQTAIYIPSSSSVGTLYYYAIVSNGCSSIKTANATGAFVVLAPSVSGIVSSAQTICAGTAPSDLVLSGYAGTILKWQKANDFGFTVGVSDIATTTATLTSATIGNLLQTTFFRALIQKGTCTIVTTIPVQILIKSTNWTGTWSNGAPDSLSTAIFSADYNSAGNINACSVIVNSGNVVFNSLDNLIVQNEVNVAGGSLTFQNNASLVQINNAVNSGSITYKRNTTGMKLFDYTYWCSPVFPQVLANLSPLTSSTKYFRWDTSSIYNWVNVSSLSPMDVGLGYIIRAPQNFTAVPQIFVGSFYGIPNNGNLTTPIVVTGINNLNLIGNPYPSALDADAFLSNPANSGIVNGTIYFWTHNTVYAANQYTNNDYAMYNFTGGVGTGTTATASGINNSVPNGKIASGEAFFIEGITSGVATFKNSMRVSGSNNQFFRPGLNATSPTLEKNRIWLEISNNQDAFKQMLIGYIEGATAQKDRNFDGDLIDIGNTLTLYSLQGTDKLSIKGVGLPFVDSDIHTLGYSATIAGNYEIKLSNFDGLFGNQNIFLEDKLLHVVRDLKQSSYTFDTEIGTFEDRFVLKFTNNELSINATSWDENITVYKNQKQIIINAGTTLIDCIKIFDITGRLILDKGNINATQTSVNIELTNQVLILQVRDNQNRLSVKKIKT